MEALQSHALRGSVLRRMRAKGDAGISLIELMAAIVVFGIAATGIMAGFIAASQKTRLDKNRVAASNLVARELEIVRNQFNASAAGPLAVAADPDDCAARTAWNRSCWRRTGLKAIRRSN